MEQVLGLLHLLCSPEAWVPSTCPDSHAAYQFQLQLHLHCTEGARSSAYNCIMRLESAVLSGTGGTIAGVSHALKAADPAVRVFLVDPAGSGLYNKVTRGVMYSQAEAEQKRLKNPFDTITEGVGINRITQNFARCAFAAAPVANGMMLSGLLAAVLTCLHTAGLK